MLQAIARWLLTWLEKSLDPDLQARLDDLNTKIKFAKEKEAEAKALQDRADTAYAIAIAYRKGLNEKIAANQILEQQDEQALADITKRREALASDLQKAKEGIANQSDVAAIRADV